MNPDKCYLTGDSAGALLSLFTLSIEGGTVLPKKYTWVKDAVVYNIFPDSFADGKEHICHADTASVNRN